MATLTEMVATVVVHSSALAFSHFGMELDNPPPRAEAVQSAGHIVSRSPRRAERSVSRAPAQRGADSRA